MSDTPPPTEGNPSKVEPKIESKSWIGNLAERSTGLPREEKSVPEDRSGDRSLWSLAGFGIQFAVSVCIFAYLGYELDRWKGWSPWGVISLSLLAVVGNLYLLIKQALMDDKKTAGKSRKK